VTPLTATNSATPFYPDFATCCVGTGITIREKLVAAGDLDCSAARPCVVTPLGENKTLASCK
jgi:hypothetical protein